MRRKGTVKFRVIGRLGLALILIGGNAAGAQERKTPPDIHSKPGDHVSDFLEDPFVTKYRKKFFAVFSGNTSEFEQGMSELDALLAKNPNDARALVWHGNGLMVRAGLKKFYGNPKAGQILLLDSKKELDRAVSLDPENVNIIAMRAVTLHIAGQYWLEKDLPPETWQTIVHDLEKSRKIIRPDRMKRISAHARGEILSELAEAYGKLGQKEKSLTLWREVQKSTPNSKYAQQAAAVLKAEGKASAN